MLSTAMDLLDATKESIFDDEVYAKYLFMYSAALSSKVADKVTRILLTEEQMSVLCDTIDEMENLSETILEELE